MKKVLPYLISTILLTVVAVSFPGKAYAQECTATNISPSGLTYCVGEFSTQAECEDHGLEIRTPGVSVACEQWDTFSGCVEDDNGWFTCVDASGVAAGCEDRDLEYRTRRGYLGDTWCLITVNLTADQGRTITGYGNNRWNELADRYGVDPSEISATVYDILYPIGLAIGLFAIIASGYAFMTSQGQPDRVKEAKEKLTSAVLGILFIILSLVILRIIIKTLFDTSF